VTASSPPQRRPPTSACRWWLSQRAFEPTRHGIAAGHLSSRLRYALSISHEEVWNAHTHAKQRLFERATRDTGVRLDPDVFTLGFARRATAYKRPDLFFHDVDRLNRIATAAGPLQLILAGKAHPQDEAGKTIIARIVKAKTSLGSRVALVYLQDYASLSVLDGWWIEGQTEGPQCEYQGLLVGQNLEQITLRLRRQLGPHLRASPDTDRYQRPP